ncbi:hypothetical protein G7Y89_g1914 [Cudoniella acicularis]|uniref:Uncharacterized protein n=1 Tax=Cudoniella acicularis TaxID=354080 RepID=A0A8H4W6J5_9HELO|nr:hypothetical protein G7Y89_g1914 [Cudoniella acicularis]
MQEMDLDNQYGDDGDNDDMVLTDDTEEYSDNQPYTTLAAAPPRRKPQEVIASTPFAPIYRSIFTLTPPGDRLLPLLGHVNCSYLSTPGLPPTLLQLKQHAQSLIILIKSLTVSTLPGVIDNANSGLDQTLSFNDGETFDFLNDLRKPYFGPQGNHLRAHHGMPLTSLLNVLEEKNIPADGSNPAKAIYRDICPLHRAQQELPPTGQSRPYATHQALIQHANEVLELLDHEYSAKGGLLGILPKKEEKEDREKAESTLLGQMILYIQRLVQRLHDLERQHANAMDVLAGEAAVPHQTLSLLGPDGRRGREMVYPQDRFVLVNAGEDVWDFLNSQFEKKEIVDEQVMQSYKRMGVTGEAIWEKRGGKEMSRGITALDVTTRYYRLRKDPLKTIFVIPAHAEHPGTKVTREIEKQPTVVSVVKPVWPERMSMVEMKHRSDMAELKRFKSEKDRLENKVEWMTQEKIVLNFQAETLGKEVRDWKKKYEEIDNLLRSPENAGRQRLHEQTNRYQPLQQQLEDLKKQAEDNERETKRLKDAQMEADAIAQLAREARDREYENRRQELEREFEEKRRQIAEMDTMAGLATTQLAESMESAWRTQIVETQILVEHLKKEKC